MHTAPHGWCQSAPTTQSHRRSFLLLAVFLALARLASAGEPGPAPPQWQRDLDAARVLQTALLLAPAADPAADADRRQRLGQLYGQLVAQYPDRAEVQKSAGAYYNQLGQIDAALACWQRAETLDPQDAGIAEAVGSVFLQRGRVRDACGQFERAVAARPDVAAYHSDLANVLYLFRRELIAPPGRPDEQAALAEALGHFRRAAELAPGDLRLAQAYAETFYIFPKPDWQQALDAWKTVLALSGENTDFANGHLARISLRLQRPDDADTYLDRIRSPNFDGLKTNFRKQTAAIRAAGAVTPAGSPGAAPQ